MASPKSPAPEAPTVKPAKDIGDFFVLKWYTLYFCFTCEVMMISQISSIIFMIFGGAVPVLKGCNNETLENVTKNDDVCKYFANEFENDNCTPIETHEFESVNVEFQMYCKKEWLSKVGTSVQMVGQLTGNLIFGYVSDAIGRLKTLYIGNAGLAVLCLVSSFSVNIPMFIATRFFVMVMLACTYSVTNVFMAEQLPPKHRLWIMTVITYSPNYLVFSGIAYASQDWRWLSRAVGITAAVPIVLLIFVYESPRWLLRRRKYEACEKAILGIGKWDGTNTPEKVEAVNAIVNAEREKYLGASQKKLKKYTTLNLFTHRKTAVYVVFFSFSFCMTCCVFYGIVFNMERLSGSLYINTILVGAVRYSINVICAILDVQFSMIGRLILHGFSVGVMTLGSFTLFGTATAGINIPAVTTGIALLVASFCSEIFILDVVQATELLPTPIRNLGSSFIQVCGNFGHIAAPIFFELGKLWPPLPYLLMSALCLTEFVLLILLIPETKGAQLPEDTRTSSSPEVPELPSADTQPSEGDGSEAKGAEEGKTKEDAKKESGTAEAATSGTTAGDKAASPAE